MVNDNEIGVFKVEVLENDVQRYASSVVSGGGGHVSTMNGVTTGQVHSVRSTVNHHVSQEIWVRELESGQESQLSLEEVQIPVRPGHLLWLVYDQRTERLERIVNEATGESTYANGHANPEAATKLRRQARTALPLAIGLSIPIINLLGGILALGALMTTPMAALDVKASKAAVVLAKTFAFGLALFAASFWAFYMLIMDPAKSGFFMKLVGIAAVAVLMVLFTKAFKAPYVAAADRIDQRSNGIDSALLQAMAA